MAINLDERYPGRANVRTPGYPQGSFKNRTSPTAKDGSYLEQDWANDMLAFFQSLLVAANETANGKVDTVLASQYFDALRALIAAGLPSIPNASMDEKGIIQIATNDEVAEGANETKSVTPASLKQETAKLAKKQHTHAIADIEGLQEALNDRASINVAAGGINTYAFLGRRNGFSPGVLYSGSTLFFSSSENAEGSSRSGSWLCLGYSDATGETSAVFYRVS